jgi:transcriptional regulator with XRE-family HTH domain
MSTITGVNAVEYSTLSIARKIRAAREAAGLTQAQVSKRAKIRIETLSRIENASENPTVRTVSRIAKAIEQLTA